MDLRPLVFGLYRELFGKEGVYQKWVEQKKALEPYKEALRLNPNSAEAHHNLGIACLQLGNPKKAMESFKEVIRIKPDSVNAHANLGIAYWTLGDSIKAIQSYEDAIHIKPDEASVLYNLGIAYVKMGNQAKAIELLREAFRLDSDFTMAHYALGVAYFKAGNRGSALDEYKILRDVDNKLANKLFDLIYEKQSDLGLTGIYKVKENVDIDLKGADERLSADSWYNRAWAYSLMNDKIKACADLSKAISLDAKYKEIAKKAEGFKWLWKDDEFQKIVGS
jgi:tetratricopeptide (TPR) repeat protein